MDRARIERQLKLAEQELAACEKELDKQDVAVEARKKSTKWRKFDADVRTVKRRLIALKGVEEREAEALERKSQKVSGEAAVEAAE